MEHNTKLFYKDMSGELRVLDYGDTESNLLAVEESNQGSTVTEIVELGLGVPSSPVLCLIEGGKA